MRAKKAIDKTDDSAQTRSRIFGITAIVITFASKKPPSGPLSYTHLHIGVQLLTGHLQAAALQKPAQRCSGNALAQTGDHAAGPVSYTHLDVYKRQRLIRAAAFRVIDL